MSTNNNLRQYAPVVKATTAYAADKSKKDSGKSKSLREIKYGSKDGLGLTSDRTFLNMMEQAPLFLSSLWIHAFFVCPDSAARNAWLYIGFRSIYPIVFQMGMPWLFLSTLPNYMTIWYLLGSTCLKAINVAKSD